MATDRTSPPPPAGSELTTDDTFEDDSKDEVTLTSILHLYSEGGFDGIFGVTAEGLVDCSGCDTDSSPAAVEMHSIRRLEGASDPDDMVAVAAITCPACGAHGTLTLQYGPMATAQDSDVLRALRDRRDDDLAPPHSAPGEMSTPIESSAEPIDPINEEAAQIDARSPDASDQINELVEHAESLGRPTDNIG